MPRRRRLTDTSPLRRNNRVTLVILALIGCAVAVVAGGARASKPGKISGKLTIAAVTQSFAKRGNLSTNRSLTAYFHTALRAPTGCTASLELPQGLGVGSTVPMQVENIESSTNTAESEVLHFWGCSPRIARGQPKSGLPKGAFTREYTEGSTGMADPTKLATVPASASSQGQYRAHVSYLGDASLTFASAQDFLEPLVLHEPSTVNADFAGPVTLSWNRVARAVGYQISASGHNAAGTAVVWENARNSSEWRSKGVTAATRAGKLIPGDQTTCVIPARIFAKGPVLLNITALSLEVRGKGALKSVGWAQSSTSVQLGAP